VALWSYARAVSAIEHFDLSPSNTRLACYWLSLWRGDQAPPRNAFNPARVSDLLGGIALSDVGHDNAPLCRLAGTVIESGVGRITGANLLDMLSDSEKAVRRARASAIVGGAVALSRTAYCTRNGQEGVVETLQLPFFGENEGGCRQILAHINWRPEMGRSAVAKPGLGLGLPETYLALAIS
jgi:hypothetical protein